MAGIIITYLFFIGLGIGAGFTIYMFTENTKKSVIVGVISTVVLLVGLTLYLTQTASGARDVKSALSDVSGGLDRTVKVYDYDGDLLEEYKGRIDIRSTDVAGRVLFDLNGKRITIDGGIIITEEESEVSE